MSQFTITYEPVPEDTTLKEHWKTYDQHYYLEEAIEGNLGFFYNGKPIFETIIFNDAPENTWTQTNTPKLEAYRIAKWFVLAYWDILYQQAPKNPSPLEFMNWEANHCLQTIGCGAYWPNITIWNNGTTPAIHICPSYTRDDGYNYMGYDRQPHTILSLKETELITQIDNFVYKVLKQCTARGYPENKLLEVYNTLQDEKSNTKLVAEIIKELNKE